MRTTRALAVLALAAAVLWGLGTDDNSGDGASYVAASEVVLTVSDTTAAEPNAEAAAEPSAGWERSLSADIDMQLREAYLPEWRCSQMFMAGLNFPQLDEDALLAVIDDALNTPI